jgi:hypothetical protein
MYLAFRNPFGARPAAPARSDRFINEGCIRDRRLDTGRATVRQAMSQRRRVCSVSVARSTTQTYSDALSPTRPHTHGVAGGDAWRLRRRTPRDVAADKGAFDAAVNVRRPLRP